MNKTTLAVVLFIVIFLGLLGWSTFHGPRYRVRVCMAYKGQSSCKTVSGKSRDAALRGAVDNACADIASGVTTLSLAGSHNRRASTGCLKSCF